jgi:hypothetical protein
VTLDEFIAQARPGKLGHRAYVKHPDFLELYVRYTRRYIGGQTHDPVLDLAALAAREPGRGSFKRLVSYVRKEYPALGIYVESVLGPRFQQGLERMGFINVGPKVGPCFWMPRAG